MLSPEKEDILALDLKKIYMHIDRSDEAFKTVNRHGDTEQESASGSRAGKIFADAGEVEHSASFYLSFPGKGQGDNHG